MAYLRRAHTYFLDFLLPSIRHKLIEVINCSGINDIAFLLLKFFDDYVQEVRNHMDNENENIFSYAEQLLEGNSRDDFRIRDYLESHGSLTEKLEKKLKVTAREFVSSDQHSSSISTTDNMNPREKEVICCVAKGMSNKEIADNLCISAHTVTTYSRNISAKLQIHSVARLTIFAILHNMINIEDIKSLP